MQQREEETLPRTHAGSQQYLPLPAVALLSVSVSSDLSLSYHTGP